MRFVAHFDLPRSIESYYQKPVVRGEMIYLQETVLFYEPADYAWLQKFLLEKPETPQRQIEQQIGSHWRICRKPNLSPFGVLNYFGEHRQTPCQNCDICLDPPKKYDGLIDAQK